MYSAFENATNQIMWVYKYFEDNTQNKNIFNKLCFPDRVLKVFIPIYMDNWELKIFVWYRSQHNNIMGPYKWWIRFYEWVNEDEVIALSMWMSLKTSILALPLWGWKWWIVVNPKRLSQQELSQLSRWYVRKLYKYLWNEFDVPAPDVNTDKYIMSEMMDEYSRLIWNNNFWSFTWKPIEIWGSLVRDIATSLWWFYVLKNYFNFFWKPINSLRFNVLWAWNAGLNIAKLLVEQWYILTWISDSKWWIFNRDWIDYSKIQILKDSWKNVLDYDWEFEIVNNDQLIWKNCDILIPAALENQINISNVKNINTKIILELANWPTTNDADKILYEKWIVVLPDILANSWWVCVSYFEQLQNNSNYYRKKQEIEEKLKDKLDIATEKIFSNSKQKNISIRDSAYFVWIERLVNAYKYRGIY